MLSQYDHFEKAGCIMGFWSDFKKFISKGNIIDLATAVVIGNAFNKIVTGLVNNIVMPVVSLAVGGLNVADWKHVIKEAVLNEAGEVVEAETAILYGAFIQSIIDFLIVALCIFAALRILMKTKTALNEKQIAAEEAKKKAEEEAAKLAEAEAKAAAEAEESRKKAEDAEKMQLLREIRDSLRK